MKKIRKTAQEQYKDELSIGDNVPTALLDGINMAKSVLTINRSRRIRILSLFGMLMMKG